MSRIRTIKPEFPQSESVGKLSRDARLLFVMIWTILDDEGRARAASRMLASLLFPYDDDAPSLIEGWLTELEHNGFIKRYEVDGSRYMQVINWLKHQKIDHPSKSKIPSAEEEFANPREISRTLAPDLGPRTKDLGKEGSKDPSCPKPDKPVRLRHAYPDDFEAWWGDYPTDGNMSKPDAAAEWAKLLPEDRILATDALPHWLGWYRQQPKDYRVVHAVKWLKSRRFENFKAKAGQPPPLFKQWAQTA